MTKSGNSEITSNQLPATKDLNEIGPQRGETGSGASLNSPAVIDRQLQASLPQSVTQSMAEQTDKDYMLTGFELMTPIPDQDRADAITMLEASLMPLPRDETVKELTRLKVMTKSRNMEQAELSMMMSVYADELSSFPADIVRYVLRSVADTSPWFPAWADLAGELQWRTNKRKFMLDAILRGPDQIAGSIAGLIANALDK